MEKDKIATLLKSWSKTQQLRIANISKLRVRVVRGNQKYYGNINFTSSLSRTITAVSTLLLLTEIVSEDAPNCNQRDQVYAKVAK
jgi:hypothetical protein